MLTVLEDSVALGSALVSNSGCSAANSLRSFGVLELSDPVDFARCWIPGESLNAVYGEDRADRAEARAAEARTFGLVRGKTTRLNIVGIDK